MNKKQSDVTDIFFITFSGERWQQIEEGREKKNEARWRKEHRIRLEREKEDIRKLAA